MSLNIHSATTGAVSYAKYLTGPLAVSGVTVAGLHMDSSNNVILVATNPSNQMYVLIFNPTSGGSITPTYTKMF